ncbi:MAG: tetratricopeptide repeat protein [Gammaproteobacteria bacterium]|nr:tetratricopeptide repeat protein [Gammaproteobacteria bacterium]
MEAGEALEKQFPNTPYIPNLLGVVNTGLGRLEQAVAGFEKALAIKPDYAAAYNNMGGALMDKAEPDAAIESFKMALKIKPDYANPKHLIAALTGSTTATAPRVYVESLFDNYAFRFDTSLVQKLNYKIPEALAQIILTNKTGSSLGPILDLGCGTGLAGVARQKNIYDRLIHIDLIEYLSSADLDFDYFVSTDVFVYIGELSDVFHLIKSRNKRAGRLAFSTEHTEKEGYFLETSGRYSHSKAYIEELCEKFEYKISHFSTTKLRKEKKSYLTGGLYLLDFAPKPYPDHGRDY